ncbi:hypothetical protein BaRGS_00034627 [Batillaria attramentaria]|uniref:SOCS box domain-containing protein n=1 Tax=Batillaria attramentaria TaxID=370345 RepID=A0ABD0JGK6_9CAEN
MRKGRSVKPTSSCDADDTVLDAVMRGSVDTVSRLLEHGHDPDLSPPGVSPPIYRAIRFSQPDIALALVKAGCRISWPQRRKGRAVGGNQAHTCTPLLCLAADLNMSDVVLEMCKRQDCDIFARYSDNSSVMHIAVKRNNGRLVRELLHRHQPLKSRFLGLRDDKGLTPIHIAAASGNVKILSLLLGCEEESLSDTATDTSTLTGTADIAVENEVNKADKEDRTFLMKKLVNIPSLGTKYTPLHFASKGHHVCVMKFLIAHGADIDARNIDNNTALHCLCMEGNANHRAVEAVKVLLEAGADCNIAGSMKSRCSSYPRKVKQMTVPMIAACRNRVRFLQLFSDHGADFSAKNSKRMTCLMLALVSGSAEAAMYLLRHHQENAVYHTWADVKGRTYMHYVSHCGSKAGRLAELLLNQGYTYKQAAVNETDDAHCSHEYGCTQTISSQSAICWAVCHNNLNVLSAICKHDPALLLEPGCCSAPIESPLHMAIVLLHGSDFASFCRFLLKHGADPDLKLKGTTVLDFARKWRNMYAYRFLLMAKCGGRMADPSEVVGGCVPFSLQQLTMDVVRQSVRRRKHDFANDIKSLPVPRSVMAVSDSENDLLMAIKCGDADLVRDLLARGSNPNITDDLYDDQPAIVDALEQRRTEIVLSLIDAGCDVNAGKRVFSRRVRGKQCQPLLCVAVERGLELVVCRLLEHPDCDIHQSDHENNTPLHLAVSYRLDSIVRALVPHGFLNRPNLIGHTPFHSVAYIGHLEWLHLFIQQWMQENRDMVADDDLSPVNFVQFYRHFDEAEDTRENSSYVCSENQTEENSDLVVVCNGCVERRENASKSIDEGQSVEYHEKELDGSHGSRNYGEKILGFYHRVPVEGICRDWRMVRNLHLCHLPALVNARANHSGDTMLHLASVGGHVGVVEYLLAHGADANISNTYGRNPLLHMCIIGGLTWRTVAVARALMEAGCDINQKCRSRVTSFLHLTPAMVAAKRNNVQMLTALVDGGADLTALTAEDGIDCFMIALKYGACEAAWLLASTYPEAALHDIVTGKGESPLHFVSNCQRKAGEIATILLKRCFQPHIVNTSNKTPLTLAIWKGNVDVAEAILKHDNGCMLRPPYTWLPTRQYRERFAALCKRSGIGMPLCNGLTQPLTSPPLHEAVTGKLHNESKMMALCHMLLKHGADINEHHEGMTPFERALVTYRYQLALFFASLGCKIKSSRIVDSFLTSAHVGRSSTDFTSSSQEFQPGLQIFNPLSTYLSVQRLTQMETPQGRANKDIILKNAVLAVLGVVIRERLGTPHSLLALCVEKVRSCVRKHGHSFQDATSLPLPRSLIDVILYNFHLNFSK